MPFSCSHWSQPPGAGLALLEKSWHLAGQGAAVAIHGHLIGEGMPRLFWLATKPLCIGAPGSPIH